MRLKVYDDIGFDMSCYYVCIVCIVCNVYVDGNHYVSKFSMAISLLLKESKCQCLILCLQKTIDELEL